MTQQHPITPPPPELVLQWIGEHFDCTAGGELSDLEHFLTIRAAQYGADQELEACCEWLEQQTLCGHQDLLPSFRAARRPKPPSLKEQALLALNKLPPNRDCGVAHDTIRRALEQLPDNE